MFACHCALARVSVCWPAYCLTSCSPLETPSPWESLPQYPGPQPEENDTNAPTLRGTKLGKKGGVDILKTNLRTSTLSTYFSEADRLISGEADRLPGEVDRLPGTVDRLPGELPESMLNLLCSCWYSTWTQTHLRILVCLVALVLTVGRFLN